MNTITTTKNDRLKPLNCEFWNVTSVSTSHIRGIAQLHKTSFPGHNLAEYSVSLIECFYESYLGNCIFLVSVVDNQIRGFVLGGHRTELATNRLSFFRKNFVKIIYETLVRPQLYGPSISKAKNLLKRPTSTTSQKIIDYSLLSLAVSSDSKGSGLASVLICCFEKHLVRGSAYTVSARRHNLRAINFYENLGFVRHYENSEGIYFIKTVK